MSAQGSYKLGNGPSGRRTIRQITEPESFHREVYRFLGMHPNPLKNIKTISKEDVAPKLNGHK